jgi:hypothetical protein
MGKGAEAQSARPVAPGSPASPASPPPTAQVQSTGTPATPAPAPPVAAEISPATPEQQLAAARKEAELAALAAAPADLTQANAVTALVSDSGNGKTSQVCEAIEYCWETYHRIGRVYHFDSGGFGNKLLKLIRLGIAQVWAPRNHIEAFETAELCSLGYWPDKIIRADIGYADPYAPLSPPQFDRYVVWCQNGHKVAAVPIKSHLDYFQQQCPECRVLTTMANWSKAERLTIISPGFKHVGMWAFDSVTSMSDWVMEDMAKRAAAGDTSIMSGEKNQLRHTAGVIVSGSMVFGSNVIAHYGFAQLRVASWLANMRRIPRQTVPAIATFLEQRGSDDAKLPVFGPKIAGTARTSDVPAWVGNCLGLEQYARPDGRMKFRMWTRTHSSVNEGGIPHLAKHRGEPGDLPAYLEDKDEEPPFTRCSLKYFFVRLDQALARSLKAATERYPNAPALVPFTDDEDEEVVSQGTVSVGANVVPASSMPLPMIAGVVPAGQMGGAAMGGGPVPLPPGQPVAPLPPPPTFTPVASVNAPIGGSMAPPAGPLTPHPPTPMPPGAQPAVSPAAAQGALHLVPPTEPKKGEPEPAPPAVASAVASTAPASPASPQPAASSAAAPVAPPPTRAVSGRSKRPPIPSVPNT